jgi:hypothetical protein
MTQKAVARAYLQIFCGIVLRMSGRLWLVYGLDAIESLAEIALRELNVIIGLITSGGACCTDPAAVLLLLAATR